MVPTHRRFASFEAYWSYLTNLTGAISPVLRGLPSDAQHDVRTRLREDIAPFARDGAYDFPALCLNAVTT